MCQLQFSIIWPLDELQGPSQFDGTGPWSLCKLAFSLRISVSVLVKLEAKYLER